MKKALITGVTGQDGSFLSEFLLGKDYEVHGTIRRSSVDFRERIAHLEGNPHFHLHYADLGDSLSLMQVIGKVRPDEIYNLAAQSHVQVSFDSPEFTANVDATGVLRVLEAVRLCGLTETCHIYQASTSELYGKVEEVPQNENTPFHPYSPYAVAKLYGHWIVKEYREAYGMFAVNGILFNHESERRGETFVTRKITLAAGRIACGLQDKLYLGNLDSKRDWGHARDYVECMWLMLQHDTPEDFVIATKEKRARTPFITDKETVERIKSHVRALLREGINDIEREGHIYVILGIIMDALSLEDVSEPLDADLSSKIMFYINENYKTDISLSSVAAHFGYSQSHISRYFKSKFNITFNRYLNLIRLKNAVMLMHEKRHNITYCALESGFSSVRTFYRAFDEEFLCSPKELLKKC